MSSPYDTGTARDARTGAEPDGARGAKPEGQVPRLPEASAVRPAAGVVDLPAVSASGLVKEYVGGDGGIIRVLDKVSLEVTRGEMVAVVGDSGAGKSTLLHLLGALDRPSAGTVRIVGESVEGRSDEALARLRNRSVGFVFQFHHLLREFSALENVMMPLRIQGVADDEARQRATALLSRVGLAARLDHRPGAMSGGEQQRTAVARALVARPAVLLADEPSGNLDRNNAERLHALFADLAQDLSMGIIVVTHNQSLAARAHRALLMQDGRLVDTDAHAGARSDSGEELH